MKTDKIQEENLETREITREKAFIHYILSNNIRDIASKAGVAVSTITRWVEDGNWAEQKQGHYDLVHKYMLESLENNLIPKQLELIERAIERLYEQLETLDEAETGTRLDVWRGFNYGIEGIEKLLGIIREAKDITTDKEESSPMIELSGQGQTVYLQALQKVQEDDSYVEAKVKK